MTSMVQNLLKVGSFYVKDSFSVDGLLKPLFLQFLLFAGRGQEDLGLDESEESDHARGASLNPNPFDTTPAIAGRGSPTNPKIFG